MAAQKSRQKDVNESEHKTYKGCDFIQMFMERMGQYAELVTEFDEELWYSTVDMVTVFEDKRMTFTFRDGTQVTIKKEAWEAA